MQKKYNKTKSCLLFTWPKFYRLTCCCLIPNVNSLESVFSYSSVWWWSVHHFISTTIRWKFVQTFMVPRSCNYRLSLLVSTAKYISKYKIVFGIHSLYLFRFYKVFNLKPGHTTDDMQHQVSLFVSGRKKWHQNVHVPSGWCIITFNVLICPTLWFMTKNLQNH